MEGGGYLLLFGLTTLVFAAAWLLAVDAYGERPSEVLVAAGLYGVGLIALPLLALGWAGWLTAASLSALVLAAIALVVIAPWERGSLRSRCSAALACAVTVLRLPVRWFGSGTWLRGPSSLFVIPALLICGWTLLLSYLAPPSGWDGLWYHDPIVGFAIQNHGFSWVTVPGRLDMINGYPKTGELLHLWAALLGSRVWLEAPNSILAPVLIAGTYLLLRNLGVRRPTGVAVAVLFFLTPGVALQLRSTYVDMTFVTFVVATLGFLTRPTLRSVDVATFALGLGLLAGVKSTGVVIAAVLVLILALRLIGQRWTWRSWMVALVTVSATLLVLAGPYYVRAFLRMDNPFWPAELHVPALGIDWDGPVRFAKVPVNERTLRSLVDWPKPGVQFHDTRDNGYGNILGYWAPLVLLGLLLAVAGVLSRSSEWRSTSARALLVCLPMIATVVISPSWWWGRLNLHVILALLVLGAIAVDRLAWWLRELVCLPSLGIALWVLLSAEPGWGVTKEMAFEMLSMPPVERAAQKLLKRMPTQAVAQAREHELVAGTTVAIIDSFTLPGPLWNENYSNRVVYIPWRGAANFAAELDRADVNWVTVRDGGKQERVLLATPDQWEVVGVINPGHKAYRRKSVKTGAGSQG